MTRAGRKRKSGPRQPNGRPYEKPRLVIERETKAVMIEARQRVHGLSEERAKRMEAATELGRLALNGLLAPRNEARNAVLYLAGEFWLQTRTNAERALECQQMASGGNMERSDRGHDDSDGTDKDFIRKCSQAIELDDKLRDYASYCVGLQRTTVPSATDWVVNKLRLHQVRIETSAVKRFMEKNGIVS